jgi:cellulose synthase/poly-beta-1,6-N-acetylglucosamine synthase-like glycosyltransferase
MIPKQLRRHGDSSNEKIYGEKKVKYRVAYIPDPLCWTEAQIVTIFISQRNRWTRGTIETLKKHKR